MNSSYYSRLDTQLKNSLLKLVTPERLSIVSIEYTVLREKGQKPLLSIEILLCGAEQKKDPRLELVKKVVKKDGYVCEND